MTNVPRDTVNIEESYGNTFADLGLPDAEETLLKAQVVVVLHRLMNARKLTQTAAAKLLDVSQPDLSHILRGDFRGWSVERLMRMLTSFEQDIEIVVRPHLRSGEAGRITVSAEFA
jgi:predicted XRE-type DNA-binding protein